jgi:hypothetical protein
MGMRITTHWHLPSVLRPLASARATREDSIALFVVRHVVFGAGAGLAVAVVAYWVLFVPTKSPEGAEHAADFALSALDVGALGGGCWRCVVV